MKSHIWNSNSSLEAQKITIISLCNLKPEQEVRNMSGFGHIARVGERARVRLYLSESESKLEQDQAWPRIKNAKIIKKKLGIKEKC